MKQIKKLFEIVLLQTESDFSFCRISDKKMVKRSEILPSGKLTREEEIQCGGESSNIEKTFTGKEG